MKRPTIADIARRAGVTKAAVSFALNGQPGVSAATRERILAIADEIGFQPNSAARALSDGRAGAFGLIIDRPARTLGVEPCFMQLISGIQAELSGDHTAAAVHHGRGPGRRDRHVPVLVGAAAGGRGVPGRPADRRPAGGGPGGTADARRGDRHAGGRGLAARGLAGRRGRDPGRGRVPGRGRAPADRPGHRAPPALAHQDPHRRVPRGRPGGRAWRRCCMEGDYTGENGAAATRAAGRTASRPPRSCTTTT